MTDSRISGQGAAINIERGIPVQDGRTKPNKRRSKYPWRDMQVGDSFLARNVTQNAMATTSRYHTAKTGYEYKCASVDDGVRVWRVK